MNALDYPGPAWSPYAVGAGIGVLSWLTFYFSSGTMQLNPGSWITVICLFIGGIAVAIPLFNL